MSCWNTLEQMKQFYDSCVAYWVRMGDDEDVARCKAAWWDIVEIANSSGGNWTPAAEQFVSDLCGYKRGGYVPDEAAIRAGTCPPAKDTTRVKRNRAFPKDRLYTVTFDQELHRTITRYTFICWAESVPDAKRIARETWDKRHVMEKKTPHMFHLEAHRSETKNVDDLIVKEFLGREYTGYPAMWTFISTDFKVIPREWDV